MVAIPFFLLFSGISASAEPCRDQYQADYKERAGISRSEWNRMCDEGKEDPQSFFTDRLLQKQRRDDEIDHDRAIANQFLSTPFDELHPEEMQALLEVDPDHLEPAQRKALLKLKNRANGIPEDDATDPIPPAVDCTKPNKTLDLKLKVLGQTGYKELEWKQCHWLTKTVECDFDQLTQRFFFRAFYYCPTRRYRCFTRDDMLFLWLLKYSNGFGKRGDIEGQKIMGVSEQRLPSCERKLFLNDFPIKFTLEGEDSASTPPAPPVTGK
jgi:hypothetical protein